MAIAVKHTSKLESIKKNVYQSYEYTKENYERFHIFRKKLFKTFIDQNQEAILTDQGKPIVEFNILMPYFLRQLGEFAKHEPSIEVRPARNVQMSPVICQIVEDHIRHVNYEANKNSCSYDVYKDLLSGGFSVQKVWIDWESPMSMTKVIKKERVFDPTLCGFDPLARYSHKGDGRYSFELFPKTLEEFIREYPDVDVSKIKCLREVEGFNWSYKNQNQVDVVLQCEYYEKVKKKAKIVKLSNGHVMTDKNYQKLEAWWAQEQILEQIPAVVGKSRVTEIEKIHRYNFIESEMLEHKETDYSFLPHVFVAGNTVLLQEDPGSNVSEFIMPYIYHADGIQNLKNFAGQCLGQYLDNMIQHKWIIKKEAIPQEEDYQEALKDVQHSRAVVVQAFYDNNPDQQIPEPIREVQNPPAPAEVMETFTACDNMLQMVLGSYDAMLGTNEKDLSGIAIVEAATQNNAVAFPYLNGYLQAETQCANIIADLIPKYMNSPMELPTIDKEGEQNFMGVNGKNDDGSRQPMLNYGEKALTVEITAGVNYAIAKDKALNQIFACMQASPKVAEFFATDGFPTIIENMEFHGSDLVKEKALEWLEKQKNSPQQPNPDMLKYQAKMAELQHKQEAHQSETQVEMAKLQNEFAKVMAEIQMSKDENYRENLRVKSEHHARIKELNLKEKDLEHTHTMNHHDSIRESIKTHHEINKPEKTKEAE